MSTRRHLLYALGAAAGGLAAAAIVPIAAAYADDCSLGECTLVSGADPTDVTYSGFRPFATLWNSNQPVNVDVTTPTGQFVSGSYTVSEQDFASALLDQSIYKYSDFAPAADNAAGADSMGLSGVTVNDIAIGPGAGLDAAGNPTYALNNLDITYPSGIETEITTFTGHFTNVFEASATGSGDWILLPGQTTFALLWDSLYSPSMPDISNILDIFPPDLWGPDWATAFPPDLL